MIFWLLQVCLIELSLWDLLRGWYNTIILCIFRFVVGIVFDLWVVLWEIRFDFMSIVIFGCWVGVGCASSCTWLLVLIVEWLSYYTFKVCCFVIWFELGVAFGWIWCCWFVDFDVAFYLLFAGCYVFWFLLVYWNFGDGVL